MDVETDKTTVRSSRSLLFAGEKISRAALRLGAGIVARFLMIIIALGVAGWLLTTKTWQPLHEVITLPSGIGRETPQLDEHNLQLINTARADRAAYVPRLLESVNKQFAVLSVKTP